jgi:acyl-homoserine lactone acylase PvdQ
MLKTAIAKRKRPRPRRLDVARTCGFQVGLSADEQKAADLKSGGLRMVVDLANLDHSVQNITLGESGQVFSPYTKDQFDAWYNGRSFPMLFSDAAVEQATVHKLVLGPAKK